MKFWILKVAFATVALLAMGSAASASLINMPIVAATDVYNLLGGTATSLGSPATMNISGTGSNSLLGQIMYQVYTNGAEYAYLYQVNNTGGPNNDIITRFTLTPMGGVIPSTVLGFLETAPSGFSNLGTQIPAGADLDLNTGPTIGFSFPPALYGFPSDVIEPGHDSLTMYVLSPLPPNTVNGSLIDGSSYTGSVVGPIPEPSALALIGVGTLGLIGYGSWRRRAARTAKPAAFDQQEDPAILSFPSHASHPANAVRKAA